MPHLWFDGSYRQWASKRRWRHSIHDGKAKEVEKQYMAQLAALQSERYKLKPPCRLHGPSKTLCHVSDYEWYVELAGKGLAERDRFPMPPSVTTPGGFYEIMAGAALDAIGLRALLSDGMSRARPRNHPRRIKAGRCQGRERPPPAIVRRRTVPLCRIAHWRMAQLRRSCPWLFGGSISSVRSATRMMSATTAIAIAFCAGNPQA